jgi:phosphoglycerate kinase
MAKLTLPDVDVRGKRVLVRVDFNVPIKEDGDKIEITDDTRIREALPTINYLREQKAKTILMSHFGRPKGKPVSKYSLRPVGDYLHTLINQPVFFSHDTIGEVPKKIVAHMQDCDVALLENLRFQPEEEANDPKFASALAELGDIYVNDAFGAAHRDVHEHPRDGFPDGEGIEVSPRRARRAGQTVPGHHGRRESVRQNRRAQGIDAKGGHDSDWRRDG